MKGVVFTEFLEMAEERFSLEVVDGIIQRANPASGGIYTAVGTYPPAELVNLLSELSTATSTPIPVLLQEFGKHLLHRFVRGFPQFFEVDSVFTFLQTIDSVVHVEVKKLYPEAELPSFECTPLENGQVTMTYRSPRRLADLAEGLILGSAEHFGETLAIHREDLSGGTGEIVRFTIRRSASA